MRNNKDPKIFGEYGTKDINGNDITPKSNKIESFTITLETILTAEQAAAFAYDKMFTDWDPAALARQAEAPYRAIYLQGVMYLGDNSTDPDRMWGLFKNGKLVKLTNETNFVLDIPVDANNDELTVRSTNKMGGFGPEVHVIGTATGVDAVRNNQQGADVIYTLQGLRVDKATKGVYIMNGKKIVMK